MIDRDTKLTIWFAVGDAYRSHEAAVETLVERAREEGISSAVLREVADGATYSSGVEFDDARSRHKTSCSVRAIREAADRLDAMHERDEDCTVVDGECVVCGVSHGEPCFECGGCGFHRDGCPEVYDRDSDEYTEAMVAWRVEHPDPRDWEGNVYGPAGAPAMTEAELDEMAAHYGES